MKTSSGTIRIVVVLGLISAAIITLTAIAQSGPNPKDKFSVTIKPDNNGEPVGLKDKTVKGEAEFILLLCNGSYDDAKKLHFKHSDAKKKDFDLPEECNAARSESSPAAQLKLKTDRVTVSAAAQALADRDLTVIGPNVTQQVAAKTAADVTAVLNKLE